MIKYFLLRSEGGHYRSQPTGSGLESVAVTNGVWGQFYSFTNVAKTVLHEYFQAKTANFGEAGSAAVLVFAASRANTREPFFHAVRVRPPAFSAVGELSRSLHNVRILEVSVPPGRMSRPTQRFHSFRFFKSSRLCDTVAQEKSEELDAVHGDTPYSALGVRYLTRYLSA